MKMQHMMATLPNSGLPMPIETGISILNRMPGSLRTCNYRMQFDVGLGILTNYLPAVVCQEVCWLANLTENERRT